MFLFWDNEWKTFSSRNYFGQIFQNCILGVPRNNSLICFFKVVFSFFSGQGMWKFRTCAENLSAALLKLHSRSPQVVFCRKLIFLRKELQSYSYSEQKNLSHLHESSSRVVENAFYVPLGNFSGRNFFWQQPFFLSYLTLFKSVWAFWQTISNCLSKLLSMHSEKFLRKKPSFRKIKKVFSNPTLKKTDCVPFGKKFRQGCRKCISPVNRNIFEKKLFCG